MKAKTTWLIIVGAFLAIIGGVIYYYSEVVTRFKRILKLERQKKHEIWLTYLSLLKKYLETEQNVDVSIIEEFEKLQKKLDVLDYEVHLELKGIIVDLTGGRAVNALRRVAKIIENKLRDKANNDPGYTGNRMLANLLNYAKSESWITVGQFENMKILKDVRNAESHELAVFQDSVKVGLCIYSGIDVLQHLASDQNAETTQDS